MAPKIVLTGATGKIGSAVLHALLNYKLASPSDLVVATSSRIGDDKIAGLVAKGLTVRTSNYDSVQKMTEAFAGCERLFLVSTPHIDLDFNDCAKGGREQHHFNAIEAAQQAGISHIYYTSLAFQNPSKAAVMRAHLKTEEYLRSQKQLGFTIIREGIYSESWPLYLGHFVVPTDKRSTIVIGPDGPISWTSIPDLGLANAVILTDHQAKWAGKALWLSAEDSYTVTEIGSMVADIRRKPLTVQSASQEEYVRHYVQDKSMNAAQIEWWSSTYPALEDNECKISDSPFADLLASKGRQPKAFKDTLINMLQVSST